MGVVLWCMGVLVWWSGCAVLAVQFLGPLCGLKSGAAQSCLCCSGRVQKRTQFLVPKMRTDGCAEVRWRSKKNGKVGLICGSGNATVLRLQFLNRRYIPHHGRRHFLGRKTVAFSGPQFLTTASPSFGFVLTKIGIFADQLYDFCRKNRSAGRTGTAEATFSGTAFVGFYGTESGTADLPRNQKCEQVLV